MDARLKVLLLWCLAFAVHAQLHSAFGFPVKLGDEVSGVLEFFSAERR